ncbi:response regulator [Sneathiella sp. P13V-1]|uniref:PAS domain-containing hybrid sensor histidine kinase/response regulator n=1 Tax=Sneathiella sp. P13V-1 TaxID=2697366 RepID=UPI00187B52DC|nr:PAS domain-containing hybrid sensor histidine kinase/response regulator [Sneathiella sp. P13V-1]MBE7635315.1 response regulator [Sneathiella sp. P13V-1]
MSDKAAENQNNGLQIDSSTRAILDASPIGVTIIDRNTTELLFANPVVQQHYSKNNFDELSEIDPSKTWVDHDQFDFIVDCLKNASSFTNLEAERVLPDGQKWWSLLNAQPIIFEGREASIFWQIDITARKEIESQLLKSENLLHRMFEASPVAIGITRQADSTIIFANTTYATMFGYDPEEIIGHQASDMWADKSDRIKFLEIFQKDGQIIHKEARGLRKDGSEQWVSLSWKPFEYNDEPCHIFWFTDISQQKETEFAIEKAKKQAEEATKAKSRFLATMSHEIRTPLNGVLGIAELLGNSELDDIQTKRVNSIISSGETLLAILNDVLDMSKIEAGSMELEEKNFPLRSLLDSLTLPFDEEARMKGFPLKSQFDIESDLHLFGDPTRLQQILWNLLGNAVKFTDQGKVTFSVTLVSDKQTEDQSLVRFVIEDTGCGIPEDRLDTIFEPFAQSDNSISRKFGGSGLGLSIVKNLIELMGGTVAVKSGPFGSEFTVEIPFSVITKNENGHPADGSPSSNATPLNVILAEDNAVNAMIARAFLEEAGHTVKHAKNGLEAVELAKEHWADVILMDIRMPKMDGIEATQTIRKFLTDTDLPIVAVTAEVFKEKHDEFSSAGIQQVITKPYTVAQLNDVLSKFQ